MRVDEETELFCIKSLYDLEDNHFTEGYIYEVHKRQTHSTIILTNSGMEYCFPDDDIEKYFKKL